MGKNSHRYGLPTPCTQEARNMHAKERAVRREERLQREIKDYQNKKNYKETDQPPSL